jgi:hypothetical protein
MIHLALWVASALFLGVAGLIALYFLLLVLALPFALLGCFEDEPRSGADRNERRDKTPVCERCKGLGAVEIEAEGYAHAYAACPVCRGMKQGPDQQEQASQRTRTRWFFAFAAAFAVFMLWVVTHQH